MCPGESHGESVAGIARPHPVRRPRPGCLRSRRSLRYAPVAPGDSHCELGKLADLALDFDRSSVLLGHDVIADREAETSALPGWLRREERLEQLIFHVGRYADPIIANAD